MAFCQESYVGGEDEEDVAEKFDPFAMRPGCGEGPRNQRYSLTTLAYQQYFNDKPLARRLEDVPEIPGWGAEKKAPNGPVDRGSVRLSVAERELKVLLDNIGETDEEEKDAEEKDAEENTNVDSCPSSPKKEFFPPDALAPAATPDQVARPENPDPDSDARSPEQVQTFWSSVRSYLWIPNSEIHQSYPSSGATTPPPLKPSFP